MNDVGGSESGRGLRAVKSSRTSDSNFEYDDSEWDVGIGNLIIDLDADIEKTNEATRSTTSSSNSSAPNNLQSVPRSLTPSSAPSSQMHIPASSSINTNSSSKGKSSTTATTTGISTLALPHSASTPSGKGSTPSAASVDVSTGNSVASIRMEHSNMSDKGLKMKIKRSKPGTKSVDAKHEIVKSDVLLAAAAANTNTSSSSATKGSSGNVNSDGKTSASPAASRDGKDSKILFGQDKEPHLDASDSAKAKAKRPTPTSTHKRVKLATGVTASIVSTARKESNVENKAGTAAAASAPAGSSGNSHAKDGFSSSVSLANLGANSAFVKTSSSSNMKIPNQGSIFQANDSGSGASNSANTTNSRSLHNSTLHNSSSTLHMQLTSGSPSKGGEKGSSSSVAIAPSEKLNANSPSYGKKARAVTTFPPEKYSGPEAVNSQNHGIAGLSLSHGHRHSASAGIESVPVSAAGISLPESGVLVGSFVKDLSGAINSRVPVQQAISFQDACVGTTVGTMTDRGTEPSCIASSNTDPDCLGPCEPGTSVTLEGIVWHETESGVLVVNVTWRGKTYVGTLLDCTKSDWASPRFCDSPTSDLEMRTPKNRGKRGRAQTATPVSEPGVVDAAKPSSTKLRNGAKGRRGSATNVPFVVPPVSPLKPDQWPKRKTRGSENESQEDQPSAATKTTKRLKLNKDSSVRQAGSPAPAGSSDTPGGGPFSPALIECPEPNCSKKYKHINGLRYHQSHAHSSNFVAEDSDSNMSTASNTNLNSVVEAIGASDEIPGDARIDIEAIEGSGTESNSAPNTPVKKKTELEEKEKSYEGTSDELKASDLKHALSTKSTGKSLEKADEKASDKNESSGGKEKEVPPHAQPRPPILTVPTLPFISLQNRSPAHSLPTQRSVGSIETPEKIVREDASTMMTKAGAPAPIPTSKGIPWQPHAISTFQSQQPQSIPVTLNVPMGSLHTTNRDHGGKDLKISSDNTTSGGSSTKKAKHKKKSKEKGEKDRERDGKSKPSSDYTGRDAMKPGLFSPTSGILPSALLKEKLGTPTAEELSPRRESEGNGGHIENRDDPQSPAYSDISDANDSGAELDLNLSTGKESAGKNSVPDSLKKDGPGSFYSPFYTPLESSYMGGANNPAGQVNKCDGRNPSNQGTGGASSGGLAEDPNSEKNKAKSTSIPQHIGHMDEQQRRSSPKIDYQNIPKYHPPQQHYFSYPYPNYHFDQPYGLLPENTYNSHNRSIMEEKERERETEEQQQRARINSKGRISESSKHEDLAPTNLSSVNIKQEAGMERERGKEHSHRDRSSSLPSGLDDKNSHTSDPKSDFGGEYQESKRHGASVSHYTHSSNKHSRESRRDREDRHGKDGEGKEAGKISSRSSSSEQNRQKGESRDREPAGNEKESKNEGAKPTMETTGPPPPPTAGSYAYYGNYVGNPYSLPFDPNHHIFRQVMVPSPYPGSPFMHPHPGNMPRFSQPAAPTPLPEDLSRPNSSSSTPKALDLLQHHAAQYYASHKIHELQERALKSPSPQINPIREGGGSNLSGPTNLSSTPASPSLSSGGRGSGGPGNPSTDRKQAADLTKEVKPSISSVQLSGSGSGTESSRSPPIHHVHTHMHSHTHIGYPIIPTVPPQYSPNLTHYGVLTTPAAAPPASVIPPFPSQKPT